MNTVQSVIDKVKKSGFTTQSTGQQNPAQENKPGDSFQHSNTMQANLTPAELYEQADAIQRKLNKQTSFIRTGKPHARFSRQELIQASRKLLGDLAAVSAQITPGNKHGYTDQRDGDDPFSPYCLDIWREEIDMLERGHNATPIDKNDPPATSPASIQEGSEKQASGVQQSSLF